MKRNDINDLKTKTVDELKRSLLDLREEVARAMTDKALGKMKNTNLIKNKKKDVARVLTFLSLKEKMVAQEVKKEVEAVK